MKKGGKVMKRRILSLVLALAMVLSMVSVASAQETAAIDVVEVTVGEVVAGQAVPAVTVPGAPTTPPTKYTGTTAPPARASRSWPTAADTR